MAKSLTPASARGPRATQDDVRRIIGVAIDDPKMLDILALRPTVGDLEQAAVWLAGDSDVFGPGQPRKGIAGEIIEILAANEQEEPPRAR